ncbi:hypothetical protein DYB28_014156 [Aphanomyces astaci]|uniref:Putative auto-transporter adhesin head GIN domain-containing protein n=1 Tax=Aphanomyces astaci TaxID=112090 RepID=A0A9X8DQ26_APHAT|nr:hypothetical protein DYB28_014156 [Aphanomyces astaci]
MGKAESKKQPVVTRTWVFKESEVRGLRESIPNGKVFVSCHDSKTVETNTGTTLVHATGLAADLEMIQAHVHLHRLGGRVLDLSVDDNPKLEGRILIEVYVDEANPLTSVESTGSSRVVLEDGSLARSSVTIHKLGSGSVYVNLLNDLGIDELFVTLTGSGTIACMAPQLTITKSLVSTVQGSGGIQFLGNHIRAPSISASINGSGSTLFDAANLVAYDVVSSVVGSGSIRYAHAGSVDQHRLSVSGSGKVVTNALLANSAAVSIVGSGTIVTQAMESLHGAVVGSGSVEYVEPSPKHIQVTTSSRGEHVKLADRKPSKAATPPTVPTRDIEDDVFSFSGSFLGWLNVKFNA